MFAVDSIPAVFGVTTDVFIVFTSNIFAILGLRSLFFLIEGLVQAALPQARRGADPGLHRRQDPDRRSLQDPGWLSLGVVGGLIVGALRAVAHRLAQGGGVDARTIPPPPTGPATDPPSASQPAVVEAGQGGATLSWYSRSRRPARSPRGRRTRRAPRPRDRPPGRGRSCGAWRRGSRTAPGRSTNAWFSMARARSSDVPVILAGLAGEGRGHRDDARARATSSPVQLGEAQVVADGQAQPAPGGLAPPPARRPGSTVSDSRKRWPPGISTSNRCILR